MGAWGMGSRALQETMGVPGTIILQTSGQNKVGEASGPKRRRNRLIPSWETLEVHSLHLFSRPGRLVGSLSNESAHPGALAPSQSAGVVSNEPKEGFVLGLCVNIGVHSNGER